MRALRLLSKICKAHGIIPVSYILQQELIRVGRVCCYGGLADVSDGEYLGFPVAIKRLRLNEGDSDGSFKVPSVSSDAAIAQLPPQRLCREIIGWKYLSHPNILSLLGISVSADPHCICILTEWMPGGNVMQHARSNPEANRLRLVSVCSFTTVFILSTDVL